jgi:hypothetical protein
VGFGPLSSPRRAAKRLWIERGEVAAVEVVERYVEALSGS